MKLFILSSEFGDGQYLGILAPTKTRAERLLADLGFTKNKDGDFNATDEAATKEFREFGLTSVDNLILEELKVISVS